MGPEARSAACTVYDEDVAIPQNEGNIRSIAEDLTKVMERTEGISGLDQNLTAIGDHLGM